MVYRPNPWEEAGALTPQQTSTWGANRTSPTGSVGTEYLPMPIRSSNLPRMRDNRLANSMMHMNFHGNQENRDYDLQLEKSLREWNDVRASRLGLGLDQLRAQRTPTMEHPNTRITGYQSLNQSINGGLNRAPGQQINNPRIYIEPVRDTFYDDNFDTPESPNQFLYDREDDQLVDVLRHVVPENTIINVQLHRSPKEGFGMLLVDGEVSSAVVINASCLQRYIPLP